MVTKNEREGRAERTLGKVRWLLEVAYPDLGDRPINKIDVQEGLGRPAQAGGDGAIRERPPNAQRHQPVFRYGIATARAERDVAADLRGAITVPKDVGELLRAIEEYSGQDAVVVTIFFAPKRDMSVTTTVSPGAVCPAASSLERVARLNAVLRPPAP